MTLVKRKPNGVYHPSSFNSLFSDFFGNNFFNDTNEQSFIPSVDVSETEKSFDLHVSLPGLKKEEINVEVDNGYITISGERKFESSSEEKNYKRVESHYGSFKRSFKLPENILEEKIDGQYVDGILKLTLPKGIETKKNKVIKIK